MILIYKFFLLYVFLALMTSCLIRYCGLLLSTHSRFTTYMRYRNYAVTHTYPHASWECWTFPNLLAIRSVDNLYDICILITVIMSRHWENTYAYVFCTNDVYHNIYQTYMSYDVWYILYMWYRMYIVTHLSICVFAVPIHDSEAYRERIQQQTIWPLCSVSDS